MSILLNGEIVASNVEQVLVQKIYENIIVKGRRLPGLFIVLVGDSVESPEARGFAESRIYVKKIYKMCRKLGFICKIGHFDNDVKEEVLFEAIFDANKDEEIDGILIQLPLPPHIDEFKVVNTIYPEKDVDCKGVIQMGRLLLGCPDIRPCASFGIIMLLEYYKILIKGKHVVIFGDLKPMYLEFLFAGATVTICNNNTEDLKGHLNMADILVTSISKQDSLDYSWIKEDCTVIMDIGDMNIGVAKKKCKCIALVPLSVVPCTIIYLMQNLYQIYFAH